MSFEIYEVAGNSVVARHPLSTLRGDADRPDELFRSWKQKGEGRRGMLSAREYDRWLYHIYDFRLSTTFPVAPETTSRITPG
jgi:hypothetical protein